MQPKTCFLQRNSSRVKELNFESAKSVFFCLILIWKRFAYVSIRCHSEFGTLCAEPVSQNQFNQITTHIFRMDLDISWCRWASGQTYDRSNSIIVDVEYWRRTFWNRHALLSLLRQTGTMSVIRCDTLVMLPMRYRYRHRKSRRNVLKANWRSANRFRNFSITYIFLEMQPLRRLQNGFIVADFFILHFQKYVSRFFFHSYFIFYEMKVNRNSALEMCQLYQLNKKKSKISFYLSLSFFM